MAKRSSIPSDSSWKRSRSTHFVGVVTTVVLFGLLLLWNNDLRGTNNPRLTRVEPVSQNVTTEMFHSSVSTGMKSSNDFISTTAHYKKLNPLLNEVFTPEEERICLVHIGKTAGSTIGCLLGFDYHCEDFHDIPGGRLTRSVTRIRHSRVDDCKELPFRYYLFTTRHPLKRMQSWFTYERPGVMHSYLDEYKARAKLYLDCPFKTFNDLGEIGLINDPKNETVCQIRAWMAVTGKIPYSRHNYWNYQYYYNTLHDPSNSKILVIRTEHLEKDWLTIETDVLGGDPSKVNLKVPQRNSSPKKKEDTDLSDTARENICRALCYEIQMYKLILKRAENLSEQDVQDTLNDLRLDCPDEVDSETCPR